MIAAKRMLALDYLRGFFILVIIIDHLYRWPSLFAFITGKGELWVSAAEGFFIISGLLVGYVRGYKGRYTPLKTLVAKMVKRAATLYVWAVGLTIFLVWFCWMVTDRAGLIPYVEITRFDWTTLIWQAVTQQYVFTWIHFLQLYWIMLLLACGAVLLLRRNLAWLVVLLSAAGWVAGHVLQVEWLQWQLLFFVPSVVGFYLEPLRRWFGARSHFMQRAIAQGTMLAAGVSMAASVYVTFFTPSEAVAALFSREPLSLARVLMAGVWFSGLLFACQYALPALRRWGDWLLIWFGTRSLSAYILHSFVLCASQLLLPLSTNIWVNTAIGAGSLLATWALLRLKFVQRVAPT